MRSSIVNIIYAPEDASNPRETRRVRSDREAIVDLSEEGGKCAIHYCCNSDPSVISVSGRGSGKDAHIVNLFGCQYTQRFMLRYQALHGNPRSWMSGEWRYVYGALRRGHIYGTLYKSRIKSLRIVTNQICFISFLNKILYLFAFCR